MDIRVEGLWGFVEGGKGRIESQRMPRSQDSRCGRSEGAMGGRERLIVEIVCYWDKGC